MKNATLPPSSYVVLGLLAVYGPMTPYDLKKSIDGSVGYFWSFPRAQLYVEPERLKELGLLTEEREPEGRRRRTYSIAEEGRATLRLRPYHLDALNHTAISLIRTGGEEKEVEALFRRAIETAPYYYKSLHNYGLFERQRGNRAEARRLFGSAIEHNPDHASSYFCRGMLAWSGGDAAMAIDDFRQAKGLGYDVGKALRSERVSAENDARLAEFFR